MVNKFINLNNQQSSSFEVKIIKFHKVVNKQFMNNYIIINLVNLVIYKYVFILCHNHVILIVKRLIQLLIISTYLTLILFFIPFVYYVMLHMPDNS